MNFLKSLDLRYFELGILFSTNSFCSWSLGPLFIQQYLVFYFQVNLNQVFSKTVLFYYQFCFSFFFIVFISFKFFFFLSLLTNLVLFLLVNKRKFCFYFNFFSQFCMKTCLGHSQCFIKAFYLFLFANKIFGKKILSVKLVILHFIFC